MKKVRFTKGAEADLQRVFAWFEGKREGLGTEFLERVEEAVRHIAKAPEGAQLITNDVRRFPLHQFTDYALWYGLRQDAIVIGCLSGRRAPGIAIQRAKSLEPKPPKLES